MNRALLGFLWRRHRVAVLLCAAIPLALGLVIGVVFPKYQEQRELIEKLLSVFSFARRFFGNEQLSMLSPKGAFCMPFQHPIALISYAVLGAIPALALPAGERGRGALELLLAAPLSRARLVLTTAFFLLVVSPTIGLGAFGGSLLGGALSKVSDQLPLPEYLLIAGVAASLCYCLASVALLISTLSPDRGRATTLYGLSIFLFVGCDVTARFLDDSGQWLAFLTPYGALRPVTVVNDPASAALPLAALLGAGLALNALAALLATRRRSA